MSKGWKHSNLRYGEEIIIPNQLVVANASRLKSARYIGENSSCIHLALEFEAPSSSEEPHWGYTRSVDWAAIYSGQVKLISKEKGEIHAYRRNDITAKSYLDSKTDEHVDRREA